MVNKVGSEKYYIIISLILGLMVLALGLYFIFAEFFNQDEIDWEVCRQSIILREGNLPNGIKYVQEKFPFKCKTQVVDIDTSDEDEANKIISDTFAECHYMFGEGKYSLYGADWGIPDNMCFVCARISFTGDSDKLGILSTGNYLVSENLRGSTYFDYVYGGGNVRVDSGFKGRAEERWVFDTKDGDILVLMVYHKSQIILERLGLGGAGIAYDMFQPNKYPDQLNEYCDVVETIPA